MTELDDNIKYTELQMIFTKMQNHKAPGPNKLPMDALKFLCWRFDIIDLSTNLEAAPINFIYNMFNDIWKGNPIPEE